TEALGMLNNHDCRLRYVDAYFDHGCGYEQSCLSGSKPRHGRVFVGSFHSTMNKINPVPKSLTKLLEARLCGSKIRILAYIDQSTAAICTFGLEQDTPDSIFDLSKT